MQQVSNIAVRSGTVTSETRRRLRWRSGDPPRDLRASTTGTFLQAGSCACVGSAIPVACRAGPAAPTTRRGRARSPATPARPSTVPPSTRSTRRSTSSRTIPRGCGTTRQQAHHPEARRALSVRGAGLDRERVRRGAHGRRRLQERRARRAARTRYGRCDRHRRFRRRGAAQGQRHDRLLRAVRLPQLRLGAAHPRADQRRLSRLHAFRCDLYRQRRALDLRARRCALGRG